MLQQDLPLAIEDYALIGDCTTSRVAIQAGGAVTSGGFGRLDAEC